LAGYLKFLAVNIILSHRGKTLASLAISYLFQFFAHISNRKFFDINTFIFDFLLLMYLPNGKFVNITFRFYDGVSHEQRLYTFIFILFESGACQLKESIVMARHAAHQASITVAPRGELQF